MTDQGQPLSRRERREAEERAAAALADPSAVAPDTVAPAAQSAVAEPEAISRRERRRLERLADPMETWTAEEETAATGQIPTMTPEVIAQQEEIARVKAQEAAQDALLATGAIPQVTERVSVAESPVSPSTAVEPPAIDTNREGSPSALPSFAEELPTRAPGSEHASPGLSATLPSFDALLNEEQAGVRSSAAAATPAPAETPFDDGIPEAFRHMFPPGSLQAHSAATPVVSGTTDGAAEVRRIAEQALAEIESGNVAAASPTLVDVPFDYDNVQSPTGERDAQNKYDEMYGAPTPASVPAAHDQQFVVPELVMPTLATPKVTERDAAMPLSAQILADELASGQPFESRVDLGQASAEVDSPRVMKPPPPAAPLGSAIAHGRPPQTAGGPPVPQLAPFTAQTPSVAQNGAMAAPHNSQVAPAGPPPFTGSTPAVQPQGGSFTPGQAAPRQQQAASPFAPVGMPPQTGATPVQQGVAPFQAPTNAVAPYAPQSPLQAPQMPISQAIPVQLEEAGGIRHWKMQHIAGVGAVAFVMGVVIYTAVVSQ